MSSRIPFLLLLGLFQTTTAQATTCVPTGFTEQLIEELIASPLSRMTAAAEETALIHINEGVVNIQSADGTFQTVTRSIEQAQEIAVAYRNTRAAAIGAIGDLLKIENFCIVQPIGENNVYLHGDMYLHNAADAATRTLDGKLTVISSIELAPFLHVSGATVSVTGLRLQASLTMPTLQTFTLSGMFCAGSAVNCNPNAGSANDNRRVQGSLTISHTPTADAATATLPVFTIGGLGYVLIENIADVNTANDFLNFLGRPVSHIGIAGATLSISRERGGSHAITTSVSSFTPHLVDLEDHSEDVLADGSNAGLTDERRACELQNIVPMTCGYKILKSVVQDGARCSLITEPNHQGSTDR